MRTTHLFNTIEEFYKLAQMTYHSYDADENEFENIKEKIQARTPENQLIETLRYVTNDDIKYELGILSRLYPEIIKINDGFTKLSRFIDNIKNQVEESLEDKDIDENEALVIQDVLNKISVDIRAKSKGTIGKPDGKNALDLITKIINEYEFPEEEIEETPGMWDEQIGVGDVVFDPTAGLKTEDRAKAGVYFGKMTQYIDYAIRYNEEAERYQEILNNADPSSKTREYLEKIIAILKELAVNSKQIQFLFNKIQGISGSSAQLENEYTKNEQLIKEIEAQIVSKDFKLLKIKNPKLYEKTFEDWQFHKEKLKNDNLKIKKEIEINKNQSTDENEKEYFQAKIKNTELKDKIQFLRKRVRKINYEYQINIWKEELQQLNSINIEKLSLEKSAELKRRKMILEQQIARNEVLLSTDLHRSAERDARAELIRVLRGIGTTGKGIRSTMSLKEMEVDPSKRSEVSEEQIAKLIKKINIAKLQRVPIQGIIGYEKAVEIRELIKSRSLPGIITEFGQKIANLKVIIKQSITDAVKKNVRKNNSTEFQPYLEELTRAQQEPDPANRYLAVKKAEDALRKAINNWGEKQPDVVKFVTVEGKKLYSIRDMMQLLVPAVNKGSLEERELNLINNIILEVDKLKREYVGVRFYNNMISNLKPVYDTVSELKQASEKVRIAPEQIRIDERNKKNEELEEEAPETIKELQQMKIKSRKELFEKLQKQSDSKNDLIKKAQVSENAYEIFDRLVDEMIIKGFDDLD